MQKVGKHSDLSLLGIVSMLVQISLSDNLKSEYFIRINSSIRNLVLEELDLVPDIVFSS